MGTRKLGLEFGGKRKPQKQRPELRECKGSSSTQQILRGEKLEAILGIYIGGQVFKSFNRHLDSDLEWDALGYLECSALNLIGDIGTSELLQRLPLLNLTADY